jgi:hypothetical protein
MDTVSIVSHPCESVCICGDPSPDSPPRSAVGSHFGSQRCRPASGRSMVHCTSPHLNPTLHGISPRTQPASTRAALPASGRFGAKRPSRPRDSKRTKTGRLWCRRIHGRLFFARQDAPFRRPSEGATTIGETKSTDANAGRCRNRSVAREAQSTGAVRHVGVRYGIIQPIRRAARTGALEVGG